LVDQGIQTVIHYPVPPHKQKAYSAWNNLHLPITERIHEEVLSLPISPVITNEQVQNVVRHINSF
jgi:dTDP-4-amino-4,6-dideoxygalactose transaminase